MNYIEIAKNIAKSNMDINLKIVEIIKIKDEIERSINFNKGMIFFCWLGAIFILPLLAMTVYSNNKKNLKISLEEVNKILEVLKESESA